MSRNARHDIDLSALPTVADVDDDDLIDRDEKWHEYQRQKEAAATAAAAAVVEEPAPPEPEPEMLVDEPEPEFVMPEPEPVPEPLPLIEIQAPRVEVEAPVEVEEPPEPEVVIAPPLPKKERLIEKPARKIETPPVRLAKAEDALVMESKPADEAEKHADMPKPPEEEPLSEEEKRHLWWQRWKEKIGANSLGLSIAIHAVILLIGALITFRHVMDKQVDFLPGGSPQGKAASEALEHKVRQKKSTWLKTKPLQRVTVQSVAAEVQLPEMDMDTLNLSGMSSRMELGKLSGGLGLGAGMGLGGSGGGFGAGIGRGGMFSFLGQTAFGKRVVFVVDVSASMSMAGEGGVSRFDVLKKELDKSLGRIPPGTQYQLLFFSDFAWPHNTVDPKKAAAYEKYRWSISPEDFKKVRIPNYAYIQATPFSLAESRKIVKEADNPGGTNWGAGLLMALKGYPKPDAIFFMTDGQKSDEMGWVDIVTDENKRALPRTIIHTSVMMETDAASDMDRLAKSNGGTFSVVLKDGTVVKGDQFFKN
ncbi:MAG: hypothetical protein JNN17_22745 [Verrucomicrobiaceae bacterium]|nr:hypothetical protein [Verrucomicrobiaceae bacterium]